MRAPTALFGRLAHTIFVPATLMLAYGLLLLSVYVIRAQAWAENRPPVGVNDSYTVHGTTSVSAPGVLGNDSDPDGDTLSVSFPSNYYTGHGSAAFNSNGGFTYTPSSGYVGPDSLTYTISDQRGGSANAVVSFNVVNKPPSAGNDSFTAHGKTTFAAPGIFGNDSDPDGDSISLSFPNPGSVYYSVHGSASFNSDGSFWYSPNGGYVGTDSITYKLCDHLNACSNGTITLNVVNNPPVAATDYYVTRGNFTAPAPSLLGNDFDPDGDSFSRAFPNNGSIYHSAHGSTLFNNDGSFSYSPDTGYVGEDTINYQLCDNLYGCSMGVAVIFVTNNDNENSGAPSCNAEVGKPVNVTNGNMYLQQTDFQLPASGEALEITRTYNSNSQLNNLFGVGWSTLYDESIKPYSSRLLQLSLPDGRAIDFARTAETGAFAPMQGDFHGQMVKNADGSYDLTLTNGSLHRFNAAGKLLSLTDRNNNQTSLTYDANSRLVSVTDPFGRTLTMTNDAGGRILTVSDSSGTIATYTYGTSGELQSVTYADGSGFQFSYDFSLRPLLTSVTDKLSNIIESHVYDSLGRALTSERQNGVERVTLNYISETETEVTDALGHLTKYFFDKSRGRNVITKVEGVCSCGGSQSQTWVYDNQLNVTAMTDALNQTTTHTYDADGNELTETNALGTTEYTYNQFGQVLTVKDVMGGVTTNTHDAWGNLLSVKDASGYTTTFTYDARGQLLTVTDARLKVTSFAYDTSGNLTQKTDASGFITKFAYDERGHLTSTTDALNKVTSYGYDPAGRINRITRPDTSSVTFSYDLAGRRTGVTDARGNSTVYAYDGAHRLTGETDAAGKTTTYGYNAMSSMTSKTDALGNTTNYEYDDFNRLNKTIHPPGVPGGARITETVAYDANGNVTTKTDPMGRNTSYAYDAANRLVKVTDPLLRVTQYEYDGRSNLKAVIDALNQRYTFEYDNLGHLTKASRGGVSMSYVYDAVGNRTQRTDYNGARTNYQYDALNRLTKITYPDASTVLYSYDRLSRVVSATNATGRVALRYDNRDRLYSTTDVFNQIVSYKFDANSNRTELSFGGTLTATVAATYQYDELNRLTSLTDGAGATVGYGYDDTGNLTSRTLPNGVVTTYQYNGLERLTRLQDTLGTGVLADHQYKYNAAGVILQDIEPEATHAYTYDAAYQLKSVTSAGQTTESYAYDKVGNRTSSQRSASYQYEPFNKLASSGTATYSYDPNGNLLTRTEGGGTWQYRWDYENRLTQATRPDGVSVTYKYDALGRRVVRTPSTGVSTDYIYDGQDVVKDILSDGNTVEYLNGLGVDEKIRQRRLPTGRTFYYLQDHLGSTRILKEMDGAITEEMEYDSFGDGAGNARSRYGYTGRERDELTGLYYYRARWYDPQAGRFLSEDPIGFGGGVNFYAYVGNNPLNFSDPYGLWPQDTGPKQPDVVLQFYRSKYAKRLTKCAVKVFGCFNANRIKPLVYKNSPFVDMTKTAEELGEGKLIVLGLTFPFDEKLFGGRGLFYMASNIDRHRGNVPLQEALFRTYTHELGNNIGFRLTAPLYDKNQFGHPKGITSPLNRTGRPDFDSGAAFEKCVFRDQ